MNIWPPPLPATDQSHIAYVATQRPLGHTVFDFWLMAAQNVRRYNRDAAVHHLAHNIGQQIVMLGGLRESECQPYFPGCVHQWLLVPASTACRVQLGTGLVERAVLRCGNFTGFTVETRTLQQFRAYDVRYLMVRQFVGGVEDMRAAYAVQHYWYVAWPEPRVDRGGVAMLLDFCLQVLNGDSAFLATLPDEIGEFLLPPPTSSECSQISPIQIGDVQVTGN